MLCVEFLQIIPQPDETSCCNLGMREDGQQELPVIEGDSFLATIEEGTLSKTAIGESGESSCTMVWSENDRVSAFMQNATLWQYV